MGRLPPRLFTRSEHSLHKTLKTRPRLHEGDRIRFPISKVPADLQSFVMEKMTYTDFANFNCGDTVSSKMCNSLQTFHKLPFYLESIYFTETAMCGRTLALSSPKTLARCLPRNIQYICKTLVVKPSTWEMVKHYEMNIEKLRIYADVTSSELRDILQATKATKLDCWRLNNEAISLTEVKQLQKLTFTIDEISDEELLNLLMPSLTIWSCNLSLTSLMKLLSQWIRGERSISFIQIAMEGGFELTQVCEELAKGKTISIHPGDNDEYWICKTEDHQKCINIGLRGGNLFVAIGDQKCPRSEANLSNK